MTDKGLREREELFVQEEVDNVRKSLDAFGEQDYATVTRVVAAMVRSLKAGGKVMSAATAAQPPRLNTLPLNLRPGKTMTAHRLPAWLSPSTARRLRPLPMTTPTAPSSLARSLGSATRAMCWSASPPQARPKTSCPP